MSNCDDPPVNVNVNKTHGTSPRRLQSTVHIQTATGSDLGAADNLTDRVRFL